MEWLNSALWPRAKVIFTPDSGLTADERAQQIVSAGVTRDSGRILEGTAEQMAAEIVAFLRQRGFL